MKENDQTITREFCKGKFLVFHPKTVQEAVFIQRKALEMGFEWYARAPKKIQYIEECISEGMCIESGKIFWGPHSKRKSLLCTVHQFDEPFDANDIKNLYVPAEQAFMLEIFNNLSARIDTLTREVDSVRKELQPKKLDKRFPAEKRRPSP